jgi:glucose/arabinose dehydrogenase
MVMKRVLTRWRTVAALAISLSVVMSMGPAPAHATTYVLKLSVSGLDQPVYMVPPPGNNNRYFIVLKGGVIRILDQGKLITKPFLDMSALVTKGSEQGLLSMAFDPAYTTNRRFFVYYTDLSGSIVVASYLTLASDPFKADASSRTTLVTIPHPTYLNHNGGMLQFDPIAAKSGTSMLYFATGDGGSAGDPNDNAQNLNSDLGKMFRMDVNAASPVKEMYGYGFRNPWRFSFDKLNGDIRIGDVGQDDWEELDFIKNGSVTGKNFGWRKWEGNHLYHDQTIDETLLTWPFEEYSHGGGNCAVIGGYMYRGTIGSLYNYYLYADLCSKNIWQRKPGHNPVKMNISGQVSNMVSFAEGNLGGIYIVSKDGSIWRLTTA